MNQPAIEVGADAGKVADGPGVDGEGGFRLALGAIDEVVGGAVDYHVRLQFKEESAHCFVIGQLNLGAGCFSNLVAGLQELAQVAAELTGRTEDDGTHGNLLP